MMYTAADHTWVICAYRESTFLEACIRSLKAQTLATSIRMTTSTPCAFIEDLARRYDIPLTVNTGEAGIGGDWNFALSQVGTPVATLAHQDDIYDPDYSKCVLEKLNAARRPLIAFPDYYELRNGEKVYDNRNLRIKKVLLFPLRFKGLQGSRWVRRRVLSVSDPISCPAVTYVLENLPQPVFETRLKCDLDWQAWERLSRLNGSFCYIHRPLMGHRIHEASTTTQIIGDNNGRSAEDLEMFLKFWPRPIALLLNRLYAASQDSNRL